MELEDVNAKGYDGVDDFLDEKKEWRRLFAECWGTFLLVMVAGGASIAGKLDPRVTLAMQAVSPGLMVMVIIYFIGSISGAHVNPVVTIAFALRRNFPWKRVPPYIVAQITGAILASLFLHNVFDGNGRCGATVPETEKNLAKVFIIEMVLTLGLVNAILGTAAGPRNIGKNGGITIGAYIALAGLWAGTFTGASMNPARTIGPDIIRGDLSTTWIYVLASICGALLAVGFEWILKGRHSHKGNEEAQGDGKR